MATSLFQDELGGVNGYYQALGSTFEPGFRSLFKTVLSNVTPPANAVPAYSDPRGVMPSGTVPASNFAYQIVDTPTQLAVPVINTMQVPFIGTVTIGTVFGFTDILLSMKSTTSIVVFEGHDVVDLPTSGLSSGSNGGIQLPHKVFRPIWAGSSLGQKMMDEKTDLATVASQEYIHRSPENGIQGVGVVPSTDPPLDCLSNQSGIFPNGLMPLVIDTASDSVRASGEYISYTAVDKPLFRDVVSMTNSVIIQGRLNSSGKMDVTTAAPNGQGAVQILRYAFVNTQPNDSSSPYYQWRLAESYGVVPANMDKEKPSMSPADFLLQSAADIQMHYVYNLLDSGPDIDQKAYPPKPIKKAYALMMAKAKMDSTSLYNDVNFKAQILTQQVGRLQFGKTNSEIKAIYADSQSASTSGLDEDALTPAQRLQGKTGRVTVQRSFVSPTFVVNLGANVRAGLEYALVDYRGVKTGDPTTILVSTKASVPSPAVCRDMATNQLVFFSPEEGTAAERWFGNSQWAMSPGAVPASKLKALLIGESPLRTEGWAAVRPLEKQLDNAISSGTEGTITVPASQSATSIRFQAQVFSPSTVAPVFQMFSQTPSDTADPLFESTVVSATGVQTVRIPSLSAKGYRISGNASILGMDGVENGFLQALDGVGVPSDTNVVTLEQIKQIKAEDFPLTAESVGAAHSNTGSYCLAYLNKGRIDLAYRASIHDPFRPVRDVCMRVPNSITGTTFNFPQVENPFMLSDDASGKAMLFYVYKKRLVMKPIPVINSFLTNAETDPENNRYTMTTETELIAQMHNIAPVVVYDGGIPDRTKNIATDLQLKGIVIDVDEPSSVVQGNDANIVAYAAVKTAGKGLFAFVQDNDKIVIRRSGNNGIASWRTLAEGYVFLPDLASETATSRTEGQFPFLYYHVSTDIFSFFMFYENALIQMRIPASVFDLEDAQIVAALDNIPREVIFGKLSDDMVKRNAAATASGKAGIVLQKSVVERMDALALQFDESVSPQRIAVASIDSGHFRLFYKDNNGRLATLLSVDAGLNWQTQDQYIQKGSPA